MTSWFPYRITLVPVQNTDVPRSAVLRQTFVGALISGLLVLSLSLPGLATGSVGVTLSAAVRSVTVTGFNGTTSVAFTDCDGVAGAALSYPNSVCNSQEFTLVNGSARSHLYVHGGDMIPADSGTPWTLCFLAPQPACAAPLHPGLDQYQMQTVYATTGGGRALTNGNQCDAFAAGAVVFEDGCRAAGGAAIPGHFQLVGPSVSTDNSSTFSTTVTWTALP